MATAVSDSGRSGLDESASKMKLKFLFALAIVVIALAIVTYVPMLALAAPAPEGAIPAPGSLPPDAGTPHKELGTSTGTCVTCGELADSLQATITQTIDEGSNTLSIAAYTENLSASPTRQPVKDSILIVELTNATDLKQVYKVYTDDLGNARFDYSTWAGGCINFKILYCPFCSPGSPECGFNECLRYANIKTEPGSYDNLPAGSGIVGVDSIPDAPGVGTSALQPAELSTTRYLPDVRSTSHCPPPPPLGSAPAMCLPALLIFSLLAGSLYLTGRNPFTPFNVGTQRVGRHIRYQARGRGFQFSGTSVVSAASSLASAGKAIKDGGMKGLKKQETDAAKQRVFGYSQYQQIKAARDRGKQMIKTIGMAWKDAPGAKKASSIMEKTQRASRALEATATSAGKGVGAGTLTGQQGNIFMPGSSGISPRASELFGRQGGYGLGLLVFLASNTTIGGMLDVVVRAATGRTVFEALFINYGERRQQDTQALAEIRERMFGDGDRMHITVGGREYVIIDSRPGERDGTVVYAVQAEGRGEGGIPGGRLEVTVERVRDPNVAGAHIERVCELSYNVTRTTQAGEITELVRATLDASGRPQFTITTIEGGREITRQLGQLQYTRPEVYDQYTAPFQLNRMGFELGGNVSAFVSAVQGNISILQAAQESIQQDYQSEIQRTGQRIDGMARGSPEARSGILTAADQEAARAAELALGLPPGGLRAALARDPDLLDGVRERAGRFGDLSETAAFAVAVAEGYGRAFGSDFVERMARESGLHGTQLDLFTRAITQLVGSHSPQELAEIARDPLRFRSEVAGTLTSMTAGNPHLTQVIFGSDIPAQVHAGAIDLLGHAVADFQQELQGRGIGGDILHMVAGSDMSQLRQLAETGDMIPRTGRGGNYGDVAALLDQYARHGGELPAGLSAETQEAMGQYAFLQTMSGSVAAMGQALSGGNVDFGRFTRAEEHYMDQNRSFVDQVALDAVPRTGGGSIPADLRDRAQQGLDHQLQAYRLDESGVMDPYSLDSRDETGAAAQIHDLAKSGDYTTALAVAADRYRAYSEAGDTRSAEAYAQVMTSLEQARSEGRVGGLSGEDLSPPRRERQHEEGGPSALPLPNPFEAPRQRADGTPDPNSSLGRLVGMLPDAEATTARAVQLRGAEYAEGHSDLEAVRSVFEHYPAAAEREARRTMELTAGVGEEAPPEVRELQEKGRRARERREEGRDEAEAAVRTVTGQHTQEERQHGAEELEAALQGRTTDYEREHRIREERGEQLRQEREEDAAVRRLGLKPDDEHRAREQLAEEQRRQRRLRRMVRDLQREGEGAEE